MSILLDRKHVVVWMVSILPLISIFSNPLSNTFGPFQPHQLYLVSPSLSFSTAFLVLWQGLRTCLSPYFLWFSLCGPLEWQNPLDYKFFFSLFSGNYNQVFWLELDDMFVSQNLTKSYASRFLGRYYYYHYYSQVFHTAWVCATASLHKSSGVFIVFWSIFTML